MFGKMPIFGNSTIKIDDKGRIIIPAFCNAEKNDQLIIQKGEGNFYIIVNLFKIEEEIKQLKNKGDKKGIELLTSSIVDLVKVDSQRRISFNPHKQFAIDRKVFVHGNYDSLQVFPSEETYEQHINTLKKSF